MAGSDAAIQVRDLTRRFGQFLAVDRVSFDVARGEVFGFLGSNGAGKSTTIRMLCGLLTPSSGTALVGGVDVTRDPEGVKRRIGYMSQRFSLYELLTVDQNIRFFGGIYGLDAATLEARRRFVIDMAGLAGRESTLARDLAGGWRQRLALGCAILHEPAILFLDEPTGGVDPLSRRQFWRLIDALSQSGVTVLVTTHYLDEAERCHRVALIHAGRLAAIGTTREVKEVFAGRPILEVRARDSVEAMRVLETLPEVEKTSLFGTAVHAVLRSSAATPETIAQQLRAGGVHVDAIITVTPSLEDVFLDVIDRVAAEENTAPERAKQSAPGERSEPSERRASDPAGESEGQGLTEERERAAGRAPGERSEPSERRASEPAGESEGPSASGEGERAAGREPGERSEPSERRASEPAGESEGRSPSEKK